MQLAAIGVGETGEVRVGHRADQRGVANRGQPVELRLVRGRGDLPDGEAGEQAVELEALVNDGGVEGRDPESAIELGADQPLPLERRERFSDRNPVHAQLAGDRIEVDAIAGREVAAIGIPDPDWGATIWAVVVMKEQVPVPSLDDLRRHAASRLAPFKHPRRVVAVQSLPRTAATGQVQRRRLVQQVLGA